MIEMSPVNGNIGYKMSPVNGNIGYKHITKQELRNH